MAVSKNNKGYPLRYLGVLGCLLFVACSQPADPSKEIVVLYTREDPIIPDLPADCCRYIDLEDYQQVSPKSAKTVILAGHGQAPEYAGHDYAYVAKAIAAFAPELIVMNSCYGATTDILGALIANKSEAYIVAPPFPIYQPGFTYEPAFFTGTLQQKLQAVQTEPKYPLLRWKLNQTELQAVDQRVNKMSVKELSKRLRRVAPALVRVDFPTAFDAGGEILVPLPPERFK